MKKLFLKFNLLLVAFLFAGCPTYEELNVRTYEEFNDPAKHDKEITVTSGINLYDISIDYNVSIADIIALNDLKAPYDLKAGMKLNIPKPLIYVANNGETLGYISRKFDISVTSIASLNKVDLNVVFKNGDVVSIPRQRISKVAKARTKTIRKQSAKKIIPREIIIAKKEQEKRYKNLQISLPKKIGRFHAPVKGKLISSFGSKGKGIYNDGINIASNLGESVLAAENGIVVYTGSQLRGFGNTILIKHSSGYVTSYSHLSKIAVKRGQKISRGKKIGYVGASGNVKTPQLHFEIRKYQKILNPSKFLKYQV